MAGKKLQGQVAIVTGASRGIGAAAAEQIAMRGGAVVAVARSGEQVEAVAERLRSSGARAIGVPADVADPEQIEEVVESAIDQFGRVDILVNNAAVIWPFEELAETDPDEWAYSLNINLLGPFYLTHNVLPLMLEQQYGRIISISSGMAVRPVVGASAYCTAKAGLDMLTRVVAAEIEGTGVTANILYPGMVNTDMQEDLRSVDTSETRMDTTAWHEAYEAGRLLEPAFVGRAITWLAGPWSRNHNGVIFNVSDSNWINQINADLGA